MSEDARPNIHDPLAFAIPPRPDKDGVLLALDLDRDARLVARVNRQPWVAWAYDPLWRARSSGLLTMRAYGTAREREAMARWLITHPTVRLLDVGCGSGFYLRALHEAAPDAKLHGIDASSAFLQVGARRLRRDGVPVDLTLGDAVRLPYGDGVFDGVAFGGTPNEIRDPVAALREIARVVRPGGRVWFMAAMQAGTWMGRRSQDPLRLGGLRLPSSDTWIDMLQSAGLTVHRIEHRGPLLVATLHLAR